ncbi:MAG TPA: hypothetical protein PKY59_25445 [Pyrinomonadaceae bacterium]|nr:hypothetical protein [Pyrinomonadaceae bacterium]
MFAENSFHSIGINLEKYEVVETPTDGGIREDIPLKFKERFNRWKSELLASEFGKDQWNAYAENKNFVLVIKISSDEKQGAGTGDYKWNENGELVGATITLGNKLDKGFPNPAYFPVMNSISSFNLPDEISGTTLAATKLAHEFGHVNLTSKTKGELFRLQNKLIPDYNKILLSNGYNTKDERLTEIVNQIGGTPVEIFETREYFGEANAMNYLLDRISKKEYYCPVLNKIEDNVTTFAQNYRSRFDEIFKSKSDDGCH